VSWLPFLLLLLLLCCYCCAVQLARLVELIAAKKADDEFVLQVSLALVDLLYRPYSYLLMFNLYVSVPSTTAICWQQPMQQRQACQSHS
jgi:hypothetical protein